MTNNFGSQKNKGKVRFIKPANILKQKVGHGGIDKALITKSQRFINDVDLDFIPYAKEFLEQFSEAVKEVAKNNDGFEIAREKIVKPVMQLKANGGMFRYRLLSDVSDIALQFMDAIDEINEDGIAVLKAHENTLSVIINANLKGDGGKEGYALVKELHNACNRYFDKHTPKDNDGDSDSDKNK